MTLPTGRLRWAVVATVAVTAALVVALALAGPYHAPGPSGRLVPLVATSFAALPNVTSLTVSPGELYATSSPNCTEVWTASPSGTVSLYATLPLPASACGLGESDVALGLLPGSVAPTLFATAQGHLYEITQGGSNVTLLATFPVPAGADMSVTYDAVGSFGHDLLVTSENGDVFTFNLSTGGSALLADLHAHLENPAVAPSGFGSVAGDVLVAAQDANTVYAVAPNGSSMKFVTWTQAESVAFYSGAFCQFGNAPGLLYVANQSAGEIQSYPASALSAYVGDGFVDSEFHYAGIGAFGPNGATSFVTPGNFLEQIAFVTPIGSQTCSSGG
jgi:hypothetical protein